MITCGACGTQNQLTGRYCRKCGAKLVINQEAVTQALQDDLAEGRSMRWLAAGRSALSIGGFLLVCALVMRYVVVPAMPPADIPPVEAGSVMPEAKP